MSSALNRHLLIFLLASGVACAQNIPALVNADSSWGREHFYFPLSFAPEIDYQGVEEAVFPKGWANKDSSSFWSYAFAWRIETQSPLTEVDIQESLKYYFDGLMSDRLGVSKDSLQNTVAFFLQDYRHEAYHYFLGRLQIFDAFTLQKSLILNASIEQFFCSQKRESILLFRFSPKTFEHNIWKKLSGLTIHNTLLEAGRCR